MLESKIIEKKYALIIVLAVYQEFELLHDIVNQIKKKLSGISHCIILSHNGKHSLTRQICFNIAKEKENIVALQTEEAGIGYAYTKAINYLTEHESLFPAAWVIFWAADLPFNFSDLESFFFHQGKSEFLTISCYVGSKSHPESQCPRPLARKLMSAVYRFFNKTILSLTTSDPQGSIFIQLSLLSTMGRMVRSKDFLFSTELIYRLEKNGHHVREIPITYIGEKRKSTVKPIKDGYAMLRGLLRLRLCSSNASRRR